MINSINLTPTHKYWKNLYASNDLKSQISDSGTSEEQSVGISNSYRHNRTITMENLFAAMQSSLRPEITNTSTTASDAEDTPVLIEATEAENTTASTTASSDQSITTNGLIQPDNDLYSMDTDGDNMISKDEYNTFVTKLGIKDVSSTDEFFSKIDTNGDGNISLDELNSAHKTFMPHSGHPPKDKQVIPTDIDADKDGVLSSDEYETMVSQMGIKDALSASDFFQKYDTDSNGEITEEEIIAGLNSANQNSTTISTSEALTNSAADTTTNSYSDTSEDTTTSATNVNIVNNNSPDQKESLQSFSAQYLSLADKMMEAYEINYEYLFGNANSNTGNTI